ncbi:MAG TPA: histidine kinase, partial [Gaiellaceae bacterium]|nr:histidine kinase [Gaiellaceae bacterium]
VAASGRRRAWVCLPVAFAAFTLVLRPWVLPIAAWLPNYPYPIVAFVAGLAQRRRTELTRLLDARVVDMQAQRHRLHRLAVHQARADLARDLHDVVVHALEQMTARAGEAMRRLDASAAEAEDVLAATEAAGRTALAEMRRLLRVLRGDAGREERVPQPNLGALDDLLRAARSSVDVGLRVEGDVARVPPPVGLAAYRIVEEALTDTRRHSAAARVEVRVQVAEEEVRVEVRADGPPRKAEATPPLPRGIVGLRERAALLGGSVAAGPQGAGGYAVVARLPLSLPHDREDGPALLETAAVPTDGHAPPARLRGRSLLTPVTASLRRLGEMGWPIDVALVVVLGTTAFLETRYWSGVIGATAPSNAFSTGAYVWAVAWVALLLFRRRAPVLTGVAMAVAAFLQTYPFRFFTPVSDIGALQIAVYTIASRKPGRPHAWLVAVLGALGLLSIPPPPVTVPIIAGVGIFAVTLCGAAYVGTVVADRRRLNAELEQSLLALAEERRTQLALALQQDRLALARETHDLVGHALSLMVVQAGAARTVAGVDPEAARTAIRTTTETGEQAIEELRQLLSLLEARSAEGVRPAVRAGVEELVREARQAGLAVELQETGGRRPRPGSSLELSVYRIVQECLTNVRKHAPGAHVQVRLRYGRDSVVVRVENEAAGAERHELDGLGVGQGLLGMRERVTMFGGRFDAGPTHGGGFIVNAVMPRPEAAT